MVQSNSDSEYLKNHFVPFEELIVWSSTIDQFSQTESIAELCFHASIELLKELDIKYRIHEKGVVEFRGECDFPFFLYLHPGETECALDNSSARVALGFSVLQSLFLIQLGMWGDQRFFSAIGDVDRLDSKSISSALSTPIGFDIEAQCLELQSPVNRSTTFVVGAWANEYLSRLCEVRTACLRESFVSAIRGLILHELGHLAHGHLAFGIDSTVFNHSATRRRSTPKTPSFKTLTFPSWGCEIVADRLAIKMVFQLALRSSDNRLQGRVPALDQMICFLGLLSTYFPQHVALDLRQGNSLKDDPDHPPIWFRCYDLVKVAAQYSWINDNNLYFCIGQIANLHPLYGTLLHPVRDNEVYERHNAISAQHLAEAAKYESQFAGSKRPIAFLKGL